MTIQTTIKGNNCNGGGCPAAHIPSEGEDIFIQGYIPSTKESGALSGPEGEQFVRMPRAVFEQIARQVLNS
jgi:hypothetical protein